MSSFFERLNLGNLQIPFAQVVSRRAGVNKEANTDALEIQIQVTPGTLLLLDEIKSKAADPTRSATIERLIQNQADAVADEQEPKQTFPIALDDARPVASAAIGPMRKWSPT